MIGFAYPGQCYPAQAGAHEVLYDPEIMQIINVLLTSATVSAAALTGPGLLTAEMTAVTLLNPVVQDASGEPL